MSDKHPNIELYILCMIVVFIIIGVGINQTGKFFNNHQPEATTRCIVNTHLTPEQYVPDQHTEFFGMYKGDVLALEACDQ